MFSRKRLVREVLHEAINVRDFQLDLIRSARPDHSKSISYIAFPPDSSSRVGDFVAMLRHAGLSDTARSIACGFPVVVAMVVSTKKFLGLRIDGDQLAVSPRARSPAQDIDVVPSGSQLTHDFRREILFDLQTIGKVLMMKAGRIGGLLHIEAVIDHADKVVCHRSYDSGAAWRAEDKGQLSVPRYDGGRHGGKRTFAGSDEVGGALDETELVGSVEPGGEVVHLVVQQKAQPIDGNTGAETSVQSVRARDGVAVLVYDRKVGRLGGFKAGSAGWRSGQESCRAH